jgi:ketol-acid reductoisomerase
MPSTSRLSPVAIVGFGSQAKAWALNLRDSKRNFIIALNPGSKTAHKVDSLGLNFIFLDDPKIKTIDTFLLLIPDDQHKLFFEKNLSFLKEGSHFVYAHGYSLARYQLNQIYSKFKHSLLAPKAIASDVRLQYETKGKIGAVVHTESEKEMKFIQELSNDLGFTSLYENHYEDEMIADLFSEQSLLCSILPYASLKSFNLLVDNGISNELAFMECFLELKSISQALVNLGPEEFFKLISPNALIGSEVGRELLLDQHFDEALNTLFQNIKNKKFYQTVDDNQSHSREKILKRWKHERLNETYKKLKPELIS